jgi:hypothetical protein
MLGVQKALQQGKLCVIWRCNDILSTVLDFRSSWPWLWNIIFWDVTSCSPVDFLEEASAGIFNARTCFLLFSCWNCFLLVACLAYSLYCPLKHLKFCQPRLRLTPQDKYSSSFLLLILWSLLEFSKSHSWSYNHVLCTMFCPKFQYHFQFPDYIRVSEYLLSFESWSSSKLN